MMAEKKEDQEKQEKVAEQPKVEKRTTRKAEPKGPAPGRMREDRNS